MSLRRVAATIQVRQGKTAKRFAVQAVESYSVDSSIDTDTDGFSLTFSDPGLDYVKMRHRDAELVVDMFQYNRVNKKLYKLNRGYADSLQVAEDGKVRIIGRDISSAATDTDARPGFWKNIRPHKLVEKEAQKMGFTEFRLAKISPIKEFYTDGTETTWEKWYRMYRKKSMWIWTDNRGRLIADFLNYSAAPNYFFGTPKKITVPFPLIGGGVTPHMRELQSTWVRVENAELIKDVSNRKSVVWMFGEDDFGGLFQSTKDKKLKNWYRKNLKIVQIGDVDTMSKLRDEARHELFEGQVGSMELRLNVTDPKHQILSNNMAWIHLPTMGIDGLWYIVGSRMIGNSTTGYSQEVRLRERQYALTRRIPRDPTLRMLADEEDNIATPSSIGSALMGGVPNGSELGEDFAVAARLELPPNTAYDLFLATVLAIGQNESNFRNVREGGTIEWFDPTFPGGEGSGAAEDIFPGSTEDETIKRHHKLFANEAANPLNPFRLRANPEAGVGIMQLTSVGFKNNADKLGNKKGEYLGARWHPEHNIRAGAAALRQKIQVFPPGVANFWLGVKAYNGSGPAADAYKARIKESVEEEGGWMDTVQEALEGGTSTNQAGEEGREGSLVFKVDGYDAVIPSNTPTEIKDALVFGIKQAINRVVYVWGGDSLAEGGFDCSGLLWAMYRSAGVSFGRSRSQEMYDGVGEFRDWKSVSKDKLLPGDMVSFYPESRLTGPTHCGVYISEGLMVHSSRSFDRTAVSPYTMYGDNYLGARRVVEWSGTEGSRGRTAQGEDALDRARRNASK